VVKNEYSLLKDKSLQDITTLKEELHVAKVGALRVLRCSRSAPDCAHVQGELRSVKGDASTIGRTAESREKEVDRLKASIKALEEAKKTLQADKAAVTGEKMNLELQMKSTGARLQMLEKENEKLRDKAGKIGEARSEAQLVRGSAAHADCARSRHVVQAQAQAAEEAERAAMAVEDFKMMKVSAACFCFCLFFFFVFVF
jgi:chromosome segregation ATPase